MKNRHFIVIEHSSGTPIQKAGVNYVYYTHDAAVQSIIDSLMENFELNDDGSVADGCVIHLPGSLDSLENDKKIRAKMKSCDSLIVYHVKDKTHEIQEIRYDIVELTHIAELI
jgi:hypothetical protein